MPYLNMDDKFPRHPKILALSDGAYRLHTSGMFHCAEFLTDGLVAEQALSGLPGYSLKAVRELSTPDASGKSLWMPVDNHDGAWLGYQIHDYLQWNKPREWWQSKRAKTAARQADWRERHREK